MFHLLLRSHTDGIKLPKLFTNPFDYQPHPLVEVAREQLCSYLESREEWHEELERGKMFGVLVVRQAQSNEIGFVAAFSGYLDKKTIHPYFVPPVCDLLDPKGFFAPEEREISAINSQIAILEESHELTALRTEREELAEREESTLAPLREQYRTSKAQRRTLREECCSHSELESLSRESQRQKGEIRRAELSFREQRTAVESQINDFEHQIEELKSERQRRSAALQRLTFSNFKMLNAELEHQDLFQIFSHYNIATPPAGSGECAAPKLLQYAFRQGLEPLAMGEFWWGRSPKGEVRRHMNYYPACRGKCYPILSYMLQGLNVEPLPTPQRSEPSLRDELRVIYEDEAMIVYDKPSGLPSVRGLNHTLSVQSIAEELYPQVAGNMVVHRLDMDTSGVLILAKSAEVQRNLQQQFASHTIRKRYIAVVDGVVDSERGDVQLPLILDPNDRPRQRVDYNIGKAAFTHYERLGVEQGRTRLALYPQSGRTHQLRVHCAHHEGLDTPIVGDRLYGTPSERLLLHAEQITILHPITSRKFTLSAEPGF